MALDWQVQLCREQLKISGFIRNLFWRAAFLLTTFLILRLVGHTWDILGTYLGHGCDLAHLCNVTMITMVSGLHGAKPPTEAHHSGSEDSALTNLHFIPVNFMTSMRLCEQDTFESLWYRTPMFKLFVQRTDLFFLYHPFPRQFSEHPLRSCSVIDACAWANKTTMKLGNPNCTMKSCGHFKVDLCRLYISLGVSMALKHGIV